MINGRPDVVHLFPGVGGRDEMLLARLLPLDGASKCPRRPNRKHLFRIEFTFDAKATADIGSDNVKVRFGYAQNASEKASNEMGELGGAVECDTPVSPGRIGEDTPRLHRRGYVAMDAVSVLEGAVRHREGAVRITDVLVTGVDDVGAERFIKKCGRFAGGGLFRIEHHRQIAILDVDEFRRFVRLEGILGEDRGNWLAYITNLVDRKHSKASSNTLACHVNRGKRCHGTGELGTDDNTPHSW